MPDPQPARPPESFEGLRVGALRRSAGHLGVWSARDRLDLPVELHLVRADALPANFPPAAFLAALRVAAEVRHESLTTYTTGGRAPDGQGGEFLFAVAKQPDAAGLDEVLSRGGALAEDRALSIVQAVSGALLALERAGLRHGDVTPRRIALPGRGQVLLGPPRLVPPEAAPRNERYRSPEEARGEPGDVRSDAFVLGLVLAEMLCGEPVLKGPAAEVTRQLAAGRHPADGGVAAGSVTPTTAEFLKRLLAADPARRFPNAAALARAAAAAVAHEAPPPLTGAAPPAAGGRSGTGAAAMQSSSQSSPRSSSPSSSSSSSPPLAPPLEDSPPETAPISFGSPAEERPETAPIPAGLMASVRAAAAASSEAPSGGGAAPPARPAAADTDPESIRRAPGRLYLKGRLGETLLEIDETVCIGRPAGAADIAARPDPFPEAEYRIERGAEHDVLVALRDGVTVNGGAVREHRLAAGDVVAAPQAWGRYEREARQALRATPSGPPAGQATARAILAASVVLAVVGGFVAWRRTVAPAERYGEAQAARLASEALLRTARGAAGTPGAGASALPPDPKEKLAQEAYESARSWARQHPEDPFTAVERLTAVAETHAGTGHAALARAEAAEIGRRSRAAYDGLDKVLAQAEKDAAEGRTKAALTALAAFAEGHPGTTGAERARTLAVALEGALATQVEIDLARAESFAAAEDPDAALRIVKRLEGNATDGLLPRILAARKRFEAGARSPAGRPADGPVPPGSGAGPAKDPPGGSGRSSGPSGSGGGDAPPPKETDRESLAEDAFRAARKLADGGKEGPAIDAFLAFLRDFKDTKTREKRDHEVRGRLASLTATPEGIAKLFRGKTEVLDKGRLRISYDFSDPAQAGDFRDENAFEAPPRAAWRVDDGLLRAGRGSGAYVLDATFVNGTVIQTVRVSPDRPHDLGACFLDASEPRRFYLYILQNTFFTLGKGAAAQPFRENAIVLFGPGMWRDTPPGQIGFVRKCGSAEPAVRPAEWVEIRCAKAEANVWMKFDGKGQIQGSAYGDVKLEFQGLQPGVFVLNGAGVFDDFVVEGVPDPEWAKTRWSAILSGL